MNTVSRRLLVESVLVKELHSVLALESDAFDILACFQPHSSIPHSALLTPQMQYNSTGTIIPCTFPL